MILPNRVPHVSSIRNAIAGPAIVNARPRHGVVAILLALLFVQFDSPLSATPARPVEPVVTAPNSVHPPVLHSFQLSDQFGTNHQVAFPRQRPLLLLVGDRKGVEEVDAWLEPLKSRWGKTADIQGIADVRAVPRFLRERILTAIRKARPKPVMLDFDGSVLAGLTCVRRTANLFVVTPEGQVTAAVSGLPSPERLSAVETALQPLLGKGSIDSARTTP